MEAEMPYRVVHNPNGKFCVEKVDGGESMGCHDTESEAEGQMRALYASEKSVVSSTWINALGRVKSFIDSIIHGNTETVEVATVAENAQVDMSMSSTCPENVSIKDSVGDIVTPTETIDKNAFMVWKDQNGRFRFMCAYSNHFRDQDYPPEIISAQAHKEFIDRVEKGIDQYPELWHWHTPGTKWGVADWLCFTDEGFALASGYVLPGHEKEAELLSEMNGIRTSHGMPMSSIKYADDDGSIITRYTSTEISDLPAKCAANMLTDFRVLEVGNMIPQPKKDYLKAVGLSDETISGLEMRLEDKARAADTLGIEFKEAEVAAEPVAEPVVEPVVEVKEVEQPILTQAELVELLSVAGKSIQALNEHRAISDARIEELEKSLKGKEEKASTPPDSSSFLRKLLTLSPVGNESSAVKGNDALTKGPKETRAPAQSRIGIPFLDNLVAPSDEGG
jgi:hypothetical protein